MSGRVPSGQAGRSSTGAVPSPPSGDHPSRIEPYENTLSIEELRREVRKLWDREAALSKDLKGLPEVPSVETMRLLSAAAMSMHAIPVWEMGKALQRRSLALKRKAGIDAFDMGNGGVPWKCEYECGAGLWLVIRDAIAMEARQGGDGETRLHPKDDSAAIAQDQAGSHE